MATAAPGDPAGTPTATDAPTDSRPQTADDSKAAAAILELARHRFRTVCESETLLRQEQVADKRFLAGEQWEERERASRRADRRPCLTVNRLPAFKRQITGNARANRPDIQVRPVDDEGDPETADVFQGLIKHVEAISHADVAYDTAVDDQVTMGRGYIRLVTEFAHDLSHDLEIKIKRVRNAHTVYYDPRCIEVDYSDAMYAFVATDYSLEEFKRRFPKVDRTRLTADSFDGAIGDEKIFWWLEGDTVRVVEYFYVEHEDVIAARLSDGRDLVLPEAQAAVMESERVYVQLAAQAQQMVETGSTLGIPPQIPEPLSIVKQRKAKRRIVKWAKLTGIEVLSQGIWPGKWIPIVPVLGEETDINGRVDLRGMIRDVRDQQRTYNFMISSLVETIMLAPRAPWVIAAGQVDKFEKYWRTANQRAWAYLPYNAIASNGTFAPPPQRQTYEPAIQAIVAAIAQHDNDMKATTGLYDASLGARGPEQSGKAIALRQQQGDVGSIHYTDNLRRAQWALGRQLLDLFPKIYDVPRVIRITQADESERSVMVHANHGQDVPDALPKGVKGVFDLSAGRYDVVVDAGPGPSTRRQEAVEMMSMAIQANPELLNVIGDLYFGSMDWSKARQISARLKKTIPQAQDEAEDDDPDALKNKLAQLQQQLVERTQLLQQASEDIRIDKVKTLAAKELKLMDLKFKLFELRAKLVGEQDRQTRDFEHAEGQQDREMAQHQADTVLEVELARINRELDLAEAERARETQRDDAREARAFEAQQAEQQAAQAAGPRGVRA